MKQKDNLTDIATDLPQTPSQSNPQSQNSPPQSQSNPQPNNTPQSLNDNQVIAPDGSIVDLNHNPEKTKNK